MADPVRPMVVIAGSEALAGAVLAVVVGIGALRSDLDVVVAVATVVVWVVIVGALTLIWFGLFRRRSAARTPFVLAQLFALVVAWPLATSDLAVERVAGVVLAVAAVVGIVLGLRPAGREALT